MRKSQVMALAAALTGTIGVVSLQAAEIIVQLDDGQDAWVYQGAPNNNYNGSALQVGHADSHDTNWVYSLIRFDLPTLPEGATVSSASVELYAYSGEPKLLYESFQRSFAVHQITSSWTETGVTFATIPAFAATPLDAFTYQGPSTTLGELYPRWHSWDVTSAYTAWAADGASNFGVLVKSGTGDGQLVFASSEYSDLALKPRMVLSYAVPEPASVALVGCAGVAMIGRRRRLSR